MSSIQLKDRWLFDQLNEPAFLLNAERNIPALFSAALWLGASAVALVCMRRSRAEGWPLGIYWPLMAVLFLYLVSWPRRGVDDP